MSQTKAQLLDGKGISLFQSPIRISGSTSGYSQIDAPAVAGDQTFTLPGTGGTLDRLNRAGNVLQVVNATYSTAESRGIATYADTGLTASITPTSASSKVLVVVHHNGCGKVNNTFMGLKLLRGSTDIAKLDDTAGYTNTTTANRFGSVSISYLDSPATTSAVTYKTQFNADAATVFLQLNSSVSTITLYEIAA